MTKKIYGGYVVRTIDVDGDPLTTRSEGRILVEAQNENSAKKLILKEYKKEPRKYVQWYGSFIFRDKGIRVKVAGLEKCKEIRILVDGLENGKKLAKATGFTVEQLEDLVEGI